MSKIVCTNCQTPNPDWATFCQNCGRAIELPRATATHQRPGSMLPWLIGTLLLLILCTIASTSLGYWGVPRAVDAIQGPKPSQTSVVVTRQVIETKMITEMVYVESPPRIIIQTQVVVVKETAIVIQTQIVEQVVERVVIATPRPAEIVTLRWFVGLGTGTDPVQLEAEQSVVDDFNASHPNIKLVIEVAEYASAKDVLLTEIAAGNGPDIIGPVGWSGSNYFRGEWLDLNPYIQATDFDLGQFNPALVNMYDTDEGQVGLPFAVFPSAIFINMSLFDQAGLNYPPATYGERYQMPDGSMFVWDWDTLAEVAKLLTVDANGRNATQAGFNKNKIVQYGFTWQYENHPNYYGSFWGPGSMLAPGGYPGYYQAQAPDAWVDAWKWTYEGIWGKQPWMASATMEGSQDFGWGNPFGSGHVAMTDQPIWYTCCIIDMQDYLEFAAMPSYYGLVSGRVDADTFRIWKDTRHPAEAFEAMAYLVTEGVQKLIIGSVYQPAAYGALPALTADQASWIAAKKTQFPSVQNWDVVIAGLQYPDVPSAEGWVPNYNEAWIRGAVFADTLRNTPGLNLASEIEIYRADLEEIFNR